MQAANNQRSLFATEEAVSKSALLAFRTITNLARRTGTGFVRCFPTLAAMLRVSERRAWQLIAELKAAGWISWNPIRRRGERGIEFAPLVRLPKVSRGRFGSRSKATPQSVLQVVEVPFSCTKSAPSIALSNTKSCTLDRGTPLKTSPVGKEDDNSAGVGTETFGESEMQAVAVSCLEKIVPLHEAQELAREATKKALSTEQIERVVAAYRGQISNIRNRGAWLREAIRREFAPPSPATTHPSETKAVENVKRIKLMPEFPTVQPGAELLAATRIPALARILEKRKGMECIG